MEKTVHRKMITNVTGPIPDTVLWIYEDFALSFRTAAIDYVFDDDSVQTERSDLTESEEREIAEAVIDFLFADGRHHYQLITDHGLTAEDAGTAYAAVRSGHSGYLINDKVTEAIKVYGSFNIF